MDKNVAGQLCRITALVAALLSSGPEAGAATLTGSRSDISAGSQVDLTAEGKVDWVHWGLYTDSSLDRKAGVPPLINDFTRLDATNGYSYVYQFADNWNGYTWYDGSPTGARTNTTTGVWAYGVPAISSGFEFTVPADTTQRTLKVYVGAFNARGKLEALLSDGSRPAYTDTSLSNSGNGPSGVYSITYAAASAGQTLTIRWTLVTAMGATPNVTLQAAALSAPGANNPPIVSVTAPAAGASGAAGSDLTVEADAIDLDGSVARVEFYAGATKIGQADASPFRATWNGVPAGDYPITAVATDNGGASRASAPVEVSAYGSGGSLAGTVAFPASSVDLTAEGISDWAHWGLKSPASFDHKAAVTAQIGNFTLIGAAPAQQFGDNPIGFSWSDGTPVAATNDTKTGVFVHGPTNGFSIVAPAGRSPRVLKVYVGLYGARAGFRAHLSDFSAPAYWDESMNSVFGNYPAVYTLQYNAATDGQTLVIDLVTRELFDADYGNVTLEAATLSGGDGGGNVPPTVTLTSPANNAAFAAGADILLQADAADSDGSVAGVQFFAGTNLLGSAASVSGAWSLTWSNVAAGAYALTAVATDDLGASTTSNPVSLSVTNGAAGSVTLTDAAVGGGSFGFSFATGPGVTYDVQFTDSLEPVSWTTVTNFTGDGSAFTVRDSAGAAQRFYRVKAQ